MENLIPRIPDRIHRNRSEEDKTITILRCNLGVISIMQDKFNPFLNRFPSKHPNIYGPYGFTPNNSTKDTLQEEVTSRF